MNEKLMNIQTELKAPKNLWNDFGKYYYRNAEGICEAVKPLLEKNKCTLTLSDEMVEIGGRIYVKAIAKVVDCETNEIIGMVSAFAREPEIKKGMDESQITGTASSYARKYALNGLFLLDDTKDADTNEQRVESNNRSAAEDKKTLAQLIGKIKLETLRTGVTEASICERYKVKTLDEMTVDVAQRALKALEKSKDKEGCEQKEK